MRVRFHLRRQFLSHVLFPFIGLASIACGGTSSSNPTQSGKSPTPADEAEIGPVIASAPIGPKGGSVETPDGTVKVDLPAGALGGTTEISVRERSSPGDGEVGVVYEIGPTGTRFTSPVTLKIAYSPDDLGGRPEDQLKIATFADGHWQALADNVVDTSNHIVSGTTMHLSPYADVIIPPDEDGGAMQGGAGGAPNMIPMTGMGGTPNMIPMTGMGGMGMIMPMPSADAGASRGGDGGATSVDTGSGGDMNTGSGGATGGDVTGGGGMTQGSAGNTSSGGATSVDTNGGTNTGTAGGPASGGVNGGGGMSTGSGGMLGMGATSGTGGDGTGAGGTSSGGTCFADGATGPMGGPYPTCETSKPCSGFQNVVMRDCMDVGTGYIATCCPTVDPTGSGGAVGAGGTSGGNAGAGGVPNMGGSSSGTGGGTSMACVGDAAAGPPGGPYPTCASAEVCSAYPGSMIQDCVDTQDGYKATCCSPTIDPGGGGASNGGAPNGGSAGSAGAGGAPSSGSCMGVGAAGPPGGPYPSCETSNPCVDYPGSILQDCVDSPEGYKATCCTSAIDPGGGTGGATGTGGASSGGATGAGGAPMGGATGGGGAPAGGGATGTGGAPMGGAPGTGGAPAGGGGMCIGVGANGPQGGPYPSCETSAPCASYPGTVLTDCVDTQDGYKGMCCTTGTDPGSGGAPSGGATGGGGAPMGGTTGSGGAPSGGATGGGGAPMGGTTGGGGAPAGGSAGAPGGAPGGSCVPDDPSGPCATACSKFPGSTVSGCVDTPPSGHKGMCCLPQ